MGFLGNALKRVAGAVKKPVPTAQTIGAKIAPNKTARVGRIADKIALGKTNTANKVASMTAKGASADKIGKYTAARGVKEASRTARMGKIQGKIDTQVAGANARGAAVKAKIAARKTSPMIK